MHFACHAMSEMWRTPFKEVFSFVFACKSSLCTPVGKFPDFTGVGWYEKGWCCLRTWVSYFKLWEQCDLKGKNRRERLQRQSTPSTEGIGGLRHRTDVISLLFLWFKHSEQKRESSNGTNMELFVLSPVNLQHSTLSFEEKTNEHHGVFPPSWNKNLWPISWNFCECSQICVGFKQHAKMALADFANPLTNVQEIGPWSPSTSKQIWIYADLCDVWTAENRTFLKIHFRQNLPRTWETSRNGKEQQWRERNWVSSGDPRMTSVFLVSALSPYPVAICTEWSSFCKPGTCYHNSWTKDLGCHCSWCSCWPHATGDSGLWPEVVLLTGGNEPSDTARKQGNLMWLFSRAKAEIGVVCLREKERKKSEGEVKGEDREKDNKTDDSFVVFPAEVQKQAMPPMQRDEEQWISFQILIKTLSYGVCYFVLMIIKAPSLFPGRGCLFVVGRMHFVSGKSLSIFGWALSFAPIFTRKFQEGVFCPLRGKTPTCLFWPQWNSSVHTIKNSWSKVALAFHLKQFHPEKRPVWTPSIITMTC